MKIALFDPYLPKFTQDMIKWWQDHGHEVKAERYYNPTLIEWADVVWFDTCDNNLMSAMNPSEALQQEWLKDGIVESDMHKMDLTGKKIIVRPIDIEVWGGSHANEKLWDLVDDCIFIAPHIRDIMLADSRTQGHKMRIHTIPCGVDTTRWTWKPREHGKKIAIVSEKWIIKGMQNIVQIAYDLPRDYEFHWLGVWSNDYPYFRTYIEDFIAKNNLNFTFYDHVDSVDEWLEDKNYLLHAGMKEAFCYAVAEAMAKGIKPVPHTFYGADEIWPGLTWHSPKQAELEIINGEYDSAAYLEYLIKQRYTIDQMMESIMEVLNA